MLSAEAVRRAALASGFQLVGLARPAPIDRRPIERWLEQGMAASMRWMRERVEARLDVSRVLPRTATVVALGCCCLTQEHHRQSSPIALYARGRDYHATLHDRLRGLRRRLIADSPGLETYSCVDSGPVMEKVWAERAGLGWLGKNGMLVTRGHGSHVLLGVMLLDREADQYDEPHPNRCGRCAACVAACPTHAIVAPGVVDARLCLAHQTIEDHGPYAESLKPLAGPRAFGCDECQRVCPWNKPGHACDDPRFLPREIAQVSLPELAGLTQERFKQLTQGTAVARARHDGLRRNALVAMGATRDPAVAEVALGAADDPSPIVRDAARWALGQKDSSE
jgi:epoxyqueuosine reductase